MGQGREVGYASMEAAPAGKRVDVRDAPRDATGAENRKRSNEQMRNDQSNGEGIIDEDVYRVHNRQRQRTEKGSEVGTAQNVRISQKRGRIERGGEIESDGEQGARAAAIRARVHAGAEGVRGVRTVRLAAVTTELQCVGEYANVGMGRHKQVRWESGRWCVEEVSLGQDGGESPGGEIRGQGHGTIMSWESSDGATVDSVEDETRRRGAWELEAAAVEATAARRGYTTGAAWDEGQMREL